ncbi:hypothetical protein [Massilia cavernae]|uniref:Uncharacterized protein n=1 Tax=Massilia cavernae TaxID=2320864 RepID=A0A418Y5T9_9BURK|nr:hypothetical protein [Massilia cavernae]RJG22245.1 hypothetical protein D3872_05695 [Massilia cavernae]
MNLHCCIATGLCAALVVPWAHAAEPGIYPPADAVDANTVYSALALLADKLPAAAKDDAGGFGAPAPALLLDDARGGDGGIASDTRLSGTASGNAATNVATGANIIQSGSFVNASGVPIVIQNSGANVLIQNATVINLQLK